MTGNRNTEHEHVFQKCETCGASVKVENLVNHRSRVHPWGRLGTERPEAQPTRVRPRVARRRTFRPYVFLLGVILVASAAGFLLLRDVRQAEPTDPGAVPMRISMGGFTPNALTVRSGEEVRINLINLDNAYHSDGGGNHNFVLPGLGISVLVEPEGQRVFSVTASSPGTYTWYCDICCGGKDNPAMVGTLVVTD